MMTSAIYIQNFRLVRFSSPNDIAPLLSVILPIGKISNFADPEAPLTVPVALRYATAIRLNLGSPDDP